MTPEQRALSIVNTYRMILMQEDTDCGCEILCTSIAIKNALVAINEMILMIDVLPSDKEVIDLFDYLQQVKTELKKL
jgi:hypothetical protein